MNYSISVQICQKNLDCNVQFEYIFTTQRKDVSTGLLLSTHLLSAIHTKFRLLATPKNQF